MNIRDALLEVHSKAQATKIANYVGTEPDRFAELMKHLMGPVYRLSQRAAWPVSYCIEKHPELIKPYWGRLAGQLEREDAHVAVRRNVARLLQFVDIPKRYRGRIFDACYSLVANPNETVAVRCFSMSVAAKIAKETPELLDELRVVVSEHPNQMTAGLRSRAKRLFVTER
jgi:hypothetical protein